MLRLGSLSLVCTALIPMRNPTWVRPARSTRRMCALAACLCAMTFATGCLPSRPPLFVDLPTETATFATAATSGDVFAAAQDVLLLNGFSVASVDPQLGVLQSTYLPLRRVMTARLGSQTGAERLDGLNMRLDISTYETATQRIVEVTGIMERTGPYTDTDPVVGRYWTERLTEQIAARLSSPYTPLVEDARYFDAVAGGRSGSGRGVLGTDDTNGLLRAGGIVVGVVVVAAILVAIISPDRGD